MLVICHAGDLCDWDVGLPGFFFQGDRVGEAYNSI